MQIVAGTSGLLLFDSAEIEENFNWPWIEWISAVEQKYRVPSDAQIWISETGLALPVHDVSTFQMSLSELLQNLLQSEIEEALLLFVFDRRLFLSDNEDCSVIIKDLDQSENLDSEDIRAQMLLKAIEAAIRNLQFHIEALKQSLSTHQASSSKATHNFQLLQESFPFDMMVVKSIPVHPAFIKRGNASLSHVPPPTNGSNNLGFWHLKGHPFLIDYIDEESLGGVVDGASCHISLHNSLSDSYTCQVFDILKRANEISLTLLNLKTADSQLVISSSMFIAVLKEISGIQSDIAKVSPVRSDLESSLTALTQYYKPLLSAHRLPVAYGTTLVEIARRKEFTQILMRLCTEWSQTVQQIRRQEEQRRDSFMSQIGIYMPPELMSCVEYRVPSIEVKFVDAWGMDRSVFSDISRSDLEKFQSDLSRIRINVDSHGGHKRQQCLASNSLFKLMHVLNEMMQQLDSMSSSFDKQFADSEFFKKYIKFHESIEEGEEERDLYTGETVLKYQSRIQTLERLLKEKFNTSDEPAPINTYNTLERIIDSQKEEILALKRENEYLQNRLDSISETERIDAAIQTSQITLKVSDNILDIIDVEDKENRLKDEESIDRRSKSARSQGKATSSLSLLLKQTLKSRPSTPSSSSQNGIVRRKSLLKTAQRSQATTVLCIHTPMITNDQDHTSNDTFKSVKKKKRKFSLFLPFARNKL